MFSLFTPHGIDIPGSPAIFTETVHISAKYISNGLFDLVPISNATVGDVGVNKTSYFSKALSNSFLLKYVLVELFCNMHHNILMKAHKFLV